MKIFNCSQRSAEWFELRRGVCTASRMARVLTKRKQASLIAELIAEAAGSPLGTGYVSRAMEHGEKTEDEARRWYDMAVDVDTRAVGFVTTDDGRFGASPDLTLWQDGVMIGGAEIKCPDPKTHAAWLIDGKVPAKHVVQVHGSMIVCETAWWEFVSYVPGTDLPQMRIRVERDEYTDKLAKELDAFWDRLQEARTKLLQQ